MVKVMIDAGHGGTDSGAVGRGSKTYYEKHYTLTVAKKLESYLKSTYENVTVYMTRTYDKTLSLSQRTSLANTLNVDYFISIHFNAFNGNARGYEDFIHTPLSNSSTTARHRNAIHSKVAGVLKKYGLPNRGKKKANFHVIRETWAPAILVETCFIDNKSDQKLMDNNQFLEDMAQAYGDGIAEAFNLRKKKTAPKNTAPKSSGTLYKIQAGAFKDKEGAQTLVNRLKSKGFSAYYYLEGGLYKVQAGAFGSLANARDLESRLKRSGFSAYVYRG